MVEKMSGSGGQSRATEALFKRAESMKKWLSSETAKEKPFREDEQFTIKFNKGTVFLSAVASADIDEVTKLLDEGVDIDYKNNDGLTALHQACIDENKEMVTLLIERGADIEAVDNEGWTALHAAASAGDVEIAQILVDNGANLAAVNNEGEVPLDLAEEDEMDEFLSDEIDNQELEVEEARNEEERLLIEDATSWLNQKQIEENLDWQGATALHVAASKGYSKVISTLLQIPNIDVNFRDVDGWTPLHAAVHWGSKTACELLTDAGADFDIKNNNGQTPCDLAEPDFVKTAENCRKRSKELAKKPNFKNKRNDNGIDSNDSSIYSKETDAIEMLKKQPPRPILKGSRAKAKALRNNENNSKPVVNNDKAEEAKPTIEKIPPAKTSFTNTSVKTNSTSDVDSSATSNSTKTSTFKSSRFADRDRDTKDDKKDTTSSSTPALTRTSVGIGISSRTKTRDPEPEPAKPISSRFGQSRTDRLGGGFRQDEKKTEEPTRTTITTTSISSRLNQRPSSSSSKDEKGDDDSFLNRHRSKVKTNDENNWRTRKKDDENEPQETETKRTTRNETETIETRRSRTSAEDDSNSRMSIADRLRKKNQELLSSTLSDRGITDNNSSSRYSSTTSSTTRNTNRPSLSSSTSDTGDTKELQRRLDQALREVDEYKAKYEKMKKEKEDLEKQLEQYKEDIEKVQELRSENTRIKDENGALIRVISKLSRTPTSSS